MVVALLLLVVIDLIALMQAIIAFGWRFRHAMPMLVLVLMLAGRLAL